MNIKDLMLGDWVEPDQCRIPTTYCKVEGIYPDDTVSLDKAERLFTHDEIHPVPLDIELLERIGFKQFHPSTRLWEYGEKVFVDLHCPIDGRITIAIGGNSYQLEYLHQLQHAMRLCGVELEIKL